MMHHDLEKEEKLRSLFLILLCMCSANPYWLNDLESFLLMGIEHMKARQQMIALVEEQRKQREEFKKVQEEWRKLEGERGKEGWL